MMNKFYRACQSLTSENIWAQCDRTVTITKSKHSGWADNGEYKPLGVWEVLGYPTKLIVERAGSDDIRMCPVYNWPTYRVPMYSDTSGGQQATNDTLALGKKAASNKVVRKRPRADPSPAPDSSDCGESSEFSDEPVSEDDEEPPTCTETEQEGRGKARVKKESAKAKAKAKAVKEARAAMAKDKKAAGLALKKVHGSKPKSIFTHQRKWIATYPKIRKYYYHHHHHNIKRSIFPCPTGGGSSGWSEAAALPREVALCSGRPP